jgi:hypothetical protein
MKRYLFALLLSVLSIAACAAGDQLTVDMTQPLLDEKGKPAKDVAEITPADPTCSKCAVLTRGVAIARALDASFDDERNLPADRKWARGLLGARIIHDSAAKITVGEAKEIELVIGKAYGPQVIMQIIPLIDPNKKPAELQ